MLATTTRLFSGSKESIRLLKILISNGRMLPVNRTTSEYDDLVPERPTTSQDRGLAIVRAMYGFGAPAIWMASNAGVFIYDSGVGFHLIDTISTDIMSAETAKATWTCHGGNLYFLVAAKRGERPSRSLGDWTS